MSTTTSLVPFQGVSAIPNDLEDFRILGLLHRIITFLQVDNPKSLVLQSTKQRVLDCSVSLFSRIFQVVKKIDTAQILDVREYKACSETIWKLEKYVHFTSSVIFCTNCWYIQYFNFVYRGPSEHFARRAFGSHAQESQSRFSGF